MRKIILVFSALIILSLGVFATTDLKIEDLIIPDTYDELVEAYKNVADIAIGYQRLYNETEQALAESEADNQALMEVIKNLQDLIETQQDIINKLLDKDRINILTGVTYIPMHPDYSGIILGFTWEF